VLVKSDRSAGSGQTTFWPMAYTFAGRLGRRCQDWLRNV